MKEQIKARLWIMAPIISVGILFDQLTKIWAVNALQGGPRYSFLGDTIRIAYAENIGAFLGLGNSLPPHLRMLIFTGLVGLFLLGLFIYLLVAKQMDKLSLAALSLIFSGGFSNFIDRAMNDGAVVDFMNMGIGGLRTGIFNVADVYIMIGAGLIIAGQWLVERHKP
ncbi:signal peptidase II [Reinekea sp. G2M2-21]|uniref:signal peptidase II n=1 Tax=Reinekea sp. G2M2-21 TaxID=2788942 RepID=UPI0018AAD15C|nr:signal peptidase II [Reinekea sp. G2M2-21]